MCYESLTARFGQGIIEPENVPGTEIRLSLADDGGLRVLMARPQPRRISWLTIPFALTCNVPGVQPFLRRHITGKET